MRALRAGDAGANDGASGAADDAAGIEEEDDDDDEAIGDGEGDEVEVEDDEVEDDEAHDDESSDEATQQASAFVNLATAESSDEEDI